jgi:hypothetical protein
LRSRSSWGSNFRKIISESLSTKDFSKYSEEGRHRLLIIEEECPRIPRRGGAEIRRKVYEVDPMLCPQCGGQMKVIAFLTDFSVVDRIINHLKLTFVADKPPPPQVAYQELLMAAETSAEYFS